MAVLVEILVWLLQCQLSNIVLSNFRKFCLLYEEVLKNSWLCAKENLGGSINYDFMQHISLSNSHTYCSDPLYFLSLVKERKVGLPTRSFAISFRPRISAPPCMMCSFLLSSLVFYQLNRPYPTKIFC